MTAVATNKTRVRQCIGNNGGQSDISFALNLSSSLVGSSMKTYMRAYNLIGKKITVRSSIL